jgi:hypothetical protein
MSEVKTHASGREPGRAYCGRKTTDTARVGRAVNCIDCLAALRADGQLRSTR